MVKKVPVINIASYIDGSDKQSVVDQVAAACRDVGFLVVSGHGIPPETISRAVAATQQFFALPLDEKQKYRQPNPDVFRGYFGLAKQALAHSTGDTAAPADLREAFIFNRIHMDLADPYYQTELAKKLFPDNIWPDEAAAPGFRAVFSEYYQAMEALSTTLMRIFALALDLPERWFDDKIDKHFTNCSAYYYPPLQQAPQPNQLRGGAHSDFGSLTIVHGHPSIDGLQVWDGQDWQDAPVEPGTFVVNLGDLMAYWTNDRWVSTLHRVVVPPESEWDRDRISLVFFHQPNYDARIECIESCTDVDHPVKYEPTTSGEHLFRKLRAMHVD